jgi:hypothetical protein
MNTWSIPLAVALAAALALAALEATAQARTESLTYRCVGKDGKKYYGQTMPQQCLGMPVELLNTRGRVVKRIDAQADAEARAAKEAEERKKAEAAAATREERRRNRALFATYSTEADIDAARLRALEENRKAVKDVEAHIAEIKKLQGKNAKEMEFYTGKNKPPARLLQDIQNAEVDLKAQEGLLEAKKKEVDTINAKYDEDKRRFVELTGKK